MDNETRPYFQFLESFEDAINDIEDSSPDIQLSLYRAIVRYGLYLEEPSLKGIANTIWKLIRPVLEKQWINYFNGVKGASSGRLGGAKIGNQNAKKTTPKQPPNNPQTTPYKDKEKDKEKGIRKSSSKDDDDFSFIDSFDLEHVPKEFVVKCFKGVVAAYNIENKKAYFAKWWNDKGGQVIQAYNEQESLKIQRQQQAEAEARRKAEADDPTTFANWCKAKGLEINSMKQPEKDEIFKQYRNEILK